MLARALDTWINALNNYSYPVQLNCYKYHHKFPEFFTQEITGDRDSTIQFENNFRINANNVIEVYFEVIF